MKVRMLFADARRRISDVNHMPAMLDIFDDESDPHMMRRFELTRAADDKPLYIEREAVPPLPYHVSQCPQCQEAQSGQGRMDVLVVPREAGVCSCGERAVEGDKWCVECHPCEPRCHEGCTCYRCGPMPDAVALPPPDTSD